MAKLFLPDRLLTISEVARACSAGPKPVNNRQVYAWMQKGVRRPDGSIVRLLGTQLPGGRAVHPNDLRDFLAQLNAGQGPVLRPTPPSRRRGQPMQIMGPVIRVPRHLIGTYPDDDCQLTGAPRPAAPDSTPRGPSRQDGSRFHN